MSSADALEVPMRGSVTLPQWAPLSIRSWYGSLFFLVRIETSQRLWLVSSVLYKETLLLERAKDGSKMVVSFASSCIAMV